jgi:hypothetical protein
LCLIKNFKKHLTINKYNIFIIIFILNLLNVNINNKNNHLYQRQINKL